MTYPLDISSIVNKFTNISNGQETCQICMGPFYSNAGNYYMITLPPGASAPSDTIRAIKAISDPSTVGTTNGWNAVGTDQTPTSGDRVTIFGACTDTSNNIHVAVITFHSASAVRTLWHAVFSMTSDTWTLAPESVDANTTNKLNDSDINGNKFQHIPILVRSNGDVVINYTWNTSGAVPIRNGYARKVSGAWTTQVAMDTGTASTNAYPLGMVAGASDLFHFFWLEHTGSGHPYSSPIHHRSLNSSNTSGSHQAGANTCHFSGDASVGTITADNSAISFTYQGTLKIACFAPNSTQNNMNVAYFTDTANPTLTEASSILGTTAFSSPTAICCTGVVFYQGNIWLFTDETNDAQSVGGSGYYKATNLGDPSAFGNGSQWLQASNTSGVGGMPNTSNFIDYSISQLVAAVTYAAVTSDKPNFTELNLQSVIPPFITTNQYNQPINLKD